MNVTLIVYSWVTDGSIEIFFLIVLDLIGVCDIDSHVPSSVLELFNLLHVASITNSSLVIPLVNSCQLNCT